MLCFVFACACVAAQKIPFLLNCDGNFQLFKKTFCEGLEVEDSPVHILNGNDRLLDYICFLSCRQWKREQIPEKDRPTLPSVDD